MGMLVPQPATKRENLPMVRTHPLGTCFKLYVREITDNQGKQ